MRTLTHTLGGDLKHCAICGVELPTVYRDEKPMIVNIGDKIGLIESNNPKLALPPIAYKVGKHDSNPPCNKVIPIEQGKAGYKDILLEGEMR